MPIQNLVAALVGSGLTRGDSCSLGLSAEHRSVEFEARMASSRKQHRSSKRGYDAGHSVHQEYPVTYAQQPPDEAYGSGLSMGQQVLAEEPCVDPQYLTLRPAVPSGIGLSQGYGNSGHFQPGYEASFYPQSSGTGSSYLNPSNADLPVDDSGMST